MLKTLKFLLDGLVFCTVFAFAFSFVIFLAMLAYYVIDFSWPGWAWGAVRFAGVIGFMVGMFVIFTDEVKL